MKLLITAVVATALPHLISASLCATATLSKLLTDQYIDQCASDSGYSFISGVKPDPEEVSGMCASNACHSLLADVEAMNLTECTLPIGDQIYLFTDLVDYVSDQCDATATPAPTTAAPTPAPTTTTPAPTTAIASCTSAQLKYLLTSTYEKQCITDTGYSFTSPYSPTAAQVASMCASESCVNLFAYVASMVTTDCRIPVGGKILLLADLVDFVSDQCSASTDTPSTTVPATDSPSTPTPTPTPSTPTPTTATPVTTCATKVISSLLTDAYIDQCASDSGYSFTSGVQPDATEVAGMCASSACANLLVDVEALGLSECILPIGNKIYLFRDLVDYVSGQCSAATDTPSTTVPATDSPSTPKTTTATPSTEAPGSESPSTTAPPTGSSSGSTSTTESPNPGTSTPSTDSPTTESPGTDTPTTDTPEPTSPIHDSC